MTLILAYIAGLLTLINPCVLPVLPLVVASTGHRAGPYWLALGMGLSFVVVGVGINAFGQQLGLTPQTLTNIGALVLVAFGTIMLIPSLMTRFEKAAAGQAAFADGLMNKLPSNGPGGWLLGGMLLGAVWSPCIGPTLGAAIGLAATGENLLWVSAIMTAFALGVGTLVIAGGKGLSRMSWARKLASMNKTVMGAAFVIVGLMLYLGIDKEIERWMLSILPYWFQDLSISV